MSFFSPETSIIVLNFNGKRYLRDCLDGLLSQKYKNFEIVLVDNHSVDGSVDFIRKAYATQIKKKRIRLIINSENFGFAEGNNIGFRAINQRTKFVVLLNNDTVPGKLWLGETIRVMKKYPDINVQGTAYYTKKVRGIEKKILNEKRSGINVVGEDVPTLKQKIHEPHLLEAFHVSGNGVVVRKKDWTTLFDPDYFAYAEDTYLCWLAHMRGLKVVVNLKAVMFHLGAGVKRNSSKKFRKKLIMHGSKNQIMNVLLFYKARNILRVLPLLVLTHVGHIIDNPRKILPKIFASWWILVHLHKIWNKRAKIQAQRKVPDKNLIATMSGKFFDEEYASTLYRPAYQKIIRFLNACTLFYCRVVGLRTYEFPNKK